MKLIPHAEVNYACNLIKKIIRHRTDGSDGDGGDFGTVGVNPSPSPPLLPIYQSTFVLDLDEISVGEQ